MGGVLSITIMVRCRLAGGVIVLLMVIVFQLILNGKLLKKAGWAMIFTKDQWLMIVLIKNSLFQTLLKVLKNNDMYNSNGNKENITKKKIKQMNYQIYNKS